MRKILLITSIVFIAVSCKNEHPEKPTENSQVIAKIEDSCKTSLKEYYTIPESESARRAEWLKQNGKKVDSVALLKLSYYEHLLPLTIYENSVGQVNQERLIMTWSEIKKIIGGFYYDKYVSFNSSGNGLQMVLVDQFSEDRTCYSVPLFLSIAKELNLKDNDTTTIFEFGKVKDTQTSATDNPSVIFKVNDDDLQLEFAMNYSTKPMFVDMQNPI